MHYLTISEYARITGKTRQSVQGKIKRHKLRLSSVKVPQMMIILTDEELEAVKLESMK